MNIAIWEMIADNFKIEIIYFVVNTSHKFSIYNSNVEIQKVIPLLTVLPSIINILLYISCDRAKILQIHHIYHPDTANYMILFLAKVQSIFTNLVM